MRRYALLELAVVCVTEGRILRGLQPSVDAINADHRLELVRGIALVQELGERVNGDLRVVDTRLCDLNEFLRVAQLVTQPVIHGFIPLLIVLNFVFEKLILPGVTPRLPKLVPDTWAGLRLVISNSRDVVAAVNAHIHILISQELLIRGKELLAKPLRQLVLQVEPILVPKDVSGRVDKTFMVSDGQAAPLGVVSPRRQIAEDLRFTTALLAPEECSTEGSLEALVGYFPDIFGPPVTVAELLVALQIELVPDVLSFLQVYVCWTQVGLRQVKSDAREDLTDVRHSSGLSVGKRLFDLGDKLLNKGLSGTCIAKVRPDGLLGELLDKDVDDTVEDTWWQEELPKLLSTLTLVDMVVQTQAYVLHEGCVGVFIEEQVLLDFLGSHASHSAVVDASLTG